MKRNILKWIIFSIALAINVFILVNGLIPGDISASQSNSIAQTAAGIINKMNPGAITQQNYDRFSSIIRKLFGHFALFGLSSCFSTWAFYLFFKNPKYKYFLVLGGISSAFGLLVAGLSEIFQLFTRGRSGSIADVGIDFCGYFIGVLLVIFIIFLAKKPIFKKPILVEKMS